MKFINYLESITGIGIYPLTSLMIFFIFFLIVTLFVFRTDKSYFDRSKNIPVNNEI